MTIEYREKPSGKRLIVTTACGLCGEPLRERQGMADHLPSCPVQNLYAERGALRDGGPDPDRIQAAITRHSDNDGLPVATDGGPEVDR